MPFSAAVIHVCSAKRFLGWLVVNLRWYGFRIQYIAHAIVQNNSEFENCKMNIIVEEGHRSFQLKVFPVLQPGGGSYMICIL